MELIDCGKIIEIEALQKWPSFFIPFINSIKKNEYKRNSFILQAIEKSISRVAVNSKHPIISWRKPLREKRNKTPIDMLAAAATTAAKWIAADKKTW